LDLFAVLLGGVTALLPVFARDILHIGPDGFGLLRSGPAIGGGLMALALSTRPIQRDAGFWMLVSVASYGLATIIFAVSSWDYRFHSDFQRQHWNSHRPRHCRHTHGYRNAS
jgi:hypothetical protein